MMAKRTKKVGLSGKFGARYGVSVRKRIRDVESVSRARHPCPGCNHMAVKRVSTGIWKCRHCGLTFAGGAYSPTMVKVREEKASLQIEEE